MVTRLSGNESESKNEAILTDPRLIATNRAVDLQYKTYRVSPHLN